MSAYICEKNVFLFLVAAAQSLRFNRVGLSWYWGNPMKREEIRVADYNKARDVAEMLVRENVRSVAYRYPGDKTSATLPGAGDVTFTDRDFVRAWDCDPVQVLKTINCLEYQSCETNDWKDTEAFAFLDALKEAAVLALPGYEAAEWGAPKQPDNVVVLSALIPRRRR